MAVSIFSELKKRINARCLEMYSILILFFKLLSAHNSGIWLELKYYGSTMHLAGTNASLHRVIQRFIVMKRREYSRLAGDRRRERRHISKRGPTYLTMKNHGSSDTNQTKREIHWMHSGLSHILVDGPLRMD